MQWQIMKTTFDKVYLSQMNFGLTYLSSEIQKREINGKVSKLYPKLCKKLPDETAKIV